jgi:hypothetical protein
MSGAHAQDEKSSFVAGASSQHIRSQTPSPLTIGGSNG